jgi:methyl-accepting chemotaxis protein
MQIRTKLLLTVGCALSIPLILSSLLQNYTRAKSFAAYSDDQNIGRIALINSVLSDFVYNIDESSISMTLHSLLGTSGTDGIEIYDDKNALIVSQLADQKAATKQTPQLKSAISEAKVDLSKPLAPWSEMRKDGVHTFALQDGRNLYISPLWTTQSGKAGQFVGHLVILTNNKMIEKISKEAIVTNSIAVILILLLAFVVMTPVVNSLTGALARISSVLQSVAKGTFNLSKADLDYLQSSQNQTNELGVVGRSLNEMLTELRGRVELFNRIAERDVTVNAHLASPHDEMSLSINKMVASLSSIVGEIDRASEVVNSGSNQITAEAVNLADSAIRQTSLVSSINDSIESLRKAISDIDQAMVHVSELSKKMNEAANSGLSNVQQFSSALDDVNKSSTGITKITSIIDSIAFQTNLLALNAAVEAARAGQHGKGFAVVADEVRALASRSSQAVHETVKLVDDVKDKVQVGNRLSEETQKSFEEIFNCAAELKSSLQTVVTKFDTQNQQIESIGSEATQASHETQQTASAAEQIASQVKELSNQANQLSELVKTFRA